MLVIASRSVRTQGSSAKRRRISSPWSAFDDQQRAQAPDFGSGERPGEEDEALVGEVVHERGVIGDAGLRGDSALGPARAGFADDGEVAHRARAIREWKVFRSR